MKGSAWTRLGYRPALNGLRGVAVLLVIIRHLDLLGAPGAGQVGVGLFFALSGYLITTLLIDERETTGNVSIRGFYLRRFFRLIPALLVMLCFVLVAGEALGEPQGKQAFFAAFYLGNWAQIYGTNWAVIGHVWSLAVEEHFYLLWPVVFLAVWRRWSIKAALYLAGAIALAALALRLGLYGYTSSRRIQYGTDTRADAIIVGCAAAILTRGRHIHVPIALAAAAWLIVIGLAFTQPQGGFMLTVGFSILAVAATLTVIDARYDSLFSRILSWRPLVAVGMVSYGLYLWHYPLIALLLPRLARHMPTSAAKVGTVAAFSILTVLSYFFVEKPLLRYKRRFSGSGRDAPTGLESAA